jgi:hypothetical protein
MSMLDAHPLRRSKPVSAILAAAAILASWILFRRGAVAAAGLVFLLTAHPLPAHHGNSDYDSEHLLTLKGIITKFEFINPHAQLHLDVKNDQGNIDEWSIEMGSPNSMRRLGWNRNTVKVGDQITVTGRPLKNGNKVLMLQKLLLSNGQEVNAAGQQ